MALCVPQVFVRLDADLKTVHSEKASQTMQFAKRRSQTPKHKDAAAKSIKTFVIPVKAQAQYLCQT